MNNTMKCKWCGYKCPRFRGKGKFQGKVLFKHVVNRHEQEFLNNIGWGGTFEDYVDMIEEEDLESYDA